MAFIKNVPNRKCIKCKHRKPLNVFKEKFNSYKGYAYICLDCYETPKPKITHRVCYKCKQEKILEDFKNRTKGILGKDYICKDCHSKVRGKIQQKDKNYRGCYNCKQNKKIEDFVKKTKNKSGYSYLCKLCKSTQKKQLAQRKKPKIPDWVIRLRKNISKRKKRYGEEIISSDYLISLYNKQNGKCYYSGIDLDVNESKMKTLKQISLDRLDSALGYIIDNVVLCCYGLNLCKSDFELEEFELFLKEITKKNL
jgi:hypothetical protein